MPICNLLRDMISWISVINWMIVSFVKGTVETGAEKKLSHLLTLMHDCTHTLTRKHKLTTTLLRPGFVQFLALVLLHPLSSRVNGRTGVCQRSVHQPSLLTIAKGILQWSILVFSLVRGLRKWVGVSAHHCCKPTQLWLCEAPLTTQRENWISSDGYQMYSKSWQLFVD